MAKSKKSTKRKTESKKSKAKKPAIPFGAFQTK